MRPLVRIDPQHHHGHVAFLHQGDPGPAGRHSSVGGNATLLSSQAGRSTPPKGRQKACKPRKHGAYEPTPQAQASLTMRRT
jgi:hypothetical protein